MGHGQHMLYTATPVPGVYTCKPTGYSEAGEASAHWDTLRGGGYLQDLWPLEIPRTTAFLPLSLSKTDQANCCQNPAM